MNEQFTYLPASPIPREYIAEKWHLSIDESGAVLSAIDITGMYG